MFWGTAFIVDSVKVGQIEARDLTSARRPELELWNAVLSTQASVMNHRQPDLESAGRIAVELPDHCGSPRPGLLLHVIPVQAKEFSIALG